MSGYDINRDSEGRITSIRESAPYKSDDNDHDYDSQGRPTTSSPMTTSEIMWAICGVLFLIAGGLFVVYVAILALK